MRHTIKPSGKGASMRVLLVDDEPEVLASLRAILESLDCEVVTFEDSRQAAEKVWSESFDSIFADAEMPQLDGFELAKLIRSSPQNNTTPIVMLSDQDSIKNTRSAYKAGATCMLTKPVSKERVQSIFKMVLSPMLTLRRKQARVPFQTLVNCTCGPKGEAQFIAWSQDIGEGGMTIATSEAMQIAECVKLVFSIHWGNPPMELKARVVRQVSPICMDLEFLKLSNTDCRRIRNFMLSTPAASPARISKNPPQQNNQELSTDGPTLDEIYDALMAEDAPVDTHRTKSWNKSVASVAAMIAVTFLTYTVVTHFTMSRSVAAAATSRVGRVIRNMQPAAAGKLTQPLFAPVEAPSLTVTPSLIVAPTSGGKSITNTLVVDNQSAQELNFELVAEDMVIRQGRLVAVPGRQLPGGVAASAAFSSNVITIMPYRAARVQVTLAVPIDSQVRAVLIRLTGTDKIPAAGGITLQPSLGTLITWAEPPTPEQKLSRTGDLPHNSLMNYSVSQWPAN